MGQSQCQPAADAVGEAWPTRMLADGAEGDLALVAIRCHTPPLRPAAPAESDRPAT